MVSLGPAPMDFDTKGGTLLHDGQRAVYVSDGWPVWVCHAATWIPPGALTAEDLDWVAGHLLLAGARCRAARPALVSSIRLDGSPADTSWVTTTRV